MTEFKTKRKNIIVFTNKNKGNKAEWRTEKKNKIELVMKKKK